MDVKYTKTIVLPIFNGIRAKNFFRSGTYPELVNRRDTRIIILIPEAKLSYYRSIYKESNVFFEPLYFTSETRYGRILSTIGFNLLNTDSVRLKQYWEYVRYHKLPRFLFKRIINRLFSPLPFTIPIVRFFDRFVALDPGVVAMLEKYKPDLVIVPDLVFAPDRVVLRAAKRMGYKTIGMIRSWDNLTSKGIIQILPDVLFIHTTELKRLAIRYSRMPKDKIVVTGIPQYDIFFEKRKKTREQFLESLGIPKDRKVIMCSPFSDNYTGSAVKIIQALDKAIVDGVLPSNTHLLVRYRPSNDEIPAEMLPDSPRITFSRPCQLMFKVKSQQIPTLDWEFTDEDVELLMNSLYYSDVVINTMSTLSVDATIFDKPVINIRFDADPATPPVHSVSIYLKHDHYQSIEASGGVWRVWNMDELINAVKQYLANPKMHAEGREKMRKLQVEFLDGKSGKRVADLINDFLYAGRPLTESKQNS